MKIYIDSEYRCHSTNPDNTFREFETDFFNNKCTTFIEGYRFIPFDESWTRSDGIIFTGQMISPWKNYDELDAVQREYERQLLEEAQKELAELDAALLDAQYESLIGGL